MECRLLQNQGGGGVVSHLWIRNSKLLNRFIPHSIEPKAQSRVHKSLDCAVFKEKKCPCTDFAKVSRLYQAAKACSSW